MKRSTIEKKAQELHLNLKITPTLILRHTSQKIISLGFALNKKKNTPTLKKINELDIIMF